MSDQSLLPFNASDCEREIESAIHRGTTLPVLLDSLWDPERCPNEWLPWLAWAMSVDSWESHWSERTKRSLIAKSIHIHRTKGTVSSLNQVLDALGVVAEISEWFEDGGRPHTFTLTAWVNRNALAEADVFLNEQLYRVLQQSVNRVKPVRSHYDFRVGVLLNNGIQLAAMATHVNIAKVVAPLSLAIHLWAPGITPAPLVQTATHLRVSMEL